MGKYQITELVTYVLGWLLLLFFPNVHLIGLTLNQFGVRVSDAGLPQNWASIHQKFRESQGMNGYYLISL